jgi:hypothetical protein
MKTILAGIISLVAAGLLVAAPVPPQIKKPPVAPLPKEVVDPNVMVPPMVIEEPYEEPKVEPIITPLFSDLLQAELLLSPNNDAPLPENVDFFTPELVNALKYVAIRDEILDTRESWILNPLNKNSFPDNLEELRNRYYELKDAPPLAASYALPKNNQFLLSFNIEYRTYLEKRLIWEQDRADIIQAAIDETEYLYKIWSHIETASNDYSYVLSKRQSLAYLKKELGEHPAQLPPHVPIWRFTTR